MQVGDLREPGQNFVLNAIGKISVGLVFAPVFEGQDRDALVRNDFAALSPTGNALVDQERDNKHEHADDNEIEDPTRDATSGPHLSDVDLFRADDSLGGEFVEPG